jgi:hypothetical protein
MLRKILVILAVILVCSCSSTAFAEDLFFIDKGETIYLQSENKSRNAADDWFVTQDGLRVKIAEGIIVELKNAADAEIVFSIPEVTSYEKLSGNIFLVIPADKNRQFELSREFLNNQLVKNSHPNLIRERKPR